MKSYLFALGGLLVGIAGTVCITTGGRENARTEAAQTADSESETALSGGRAAQRNSLSHLSERKDDIRVAAADTRHLMMSTRLPLVDILDSTIAGTVEGCNELLCASGVNPSDLSVVLERGTGLPAFGSRRVTGIQLTDAPLERVLRYACLQAGCEMLVRPGEVILRPTPIDGLMDLPDPRRFLTSSSVPDQGGAAKPKRLILPLMDIELDLSEFGVESFVEFLRTRAFDLDEDSPPDQRGVPMVTLFPPSDPNLDRPISDVSEIDGLDDSSLMFRREYEAMGISIWDAAHDFAALMNIEVFFDGYALVFVAYDLEGEWARRTRANKSQQ